MTRHDSPVLAPPKRRLHPLAVVLLLALGLAGCLEPVAGPQVIIDAGDGSVLFVPDTSAPPKDTFLAELTGLDAVDATDDFDTSDSGVPPDSDDVTGSDDSSVLDDGAGPDDAAADGDTALQGDATQTADADGASANDASDDSANDTSDDSENPADGAAEVTVVDADVAEVQDADGPADASADAEPLADAATTDADLDVDLPDAATPVVCGDNVCAATETCAQCPADCGACPEVCGDGSCTASESCESCEADCGVCPGPVCDVLTSVGCLPGEQCFPDGNLNLCWAAGAAQYGEACGALDCALGALCVGGKCRTLCSTDLNPLLPGCLSGVPCQTLVGPGGPLGPNLGACQTIASCDPWSHSGCPAEQICVVEGAFKVCAMPGAQGPGSACQTSWVCAKGLVCVEGAKGSDPTAPGTCRPACDLAAPACASGTCWPTLGPDAAANPYGLGGCVP